MVEVGGGPGRKLVWLQNHQITTNAEPCGIRCIQSADPVSVDDNHNVAIIDRLELAEDSYELLSRVYPYGAGDGEVRLTMRGIVSTVPSGYAYGSETIAGITYYYIIHAATEAAYGRIEKSVSFSEIRPLDNTEAGVLDAAYELQDTAVEYLRRRISPQTAYRLSVVKLDQIVYPGQTIAVEYRRNVPVGNGTYKAVDINTDLYILEATTRIDGSDPRTTDLVVSTIDAWPTNEAEEIASLMEDGQVFKAHVQLNANSYVVSYREIMDDSHPANIRFWLGREVVNINQCLFRFRVDPLWASITAAASGTATTEGVHEATVTSGSSSDETSGSNSVAHYHDIYIADSTSGVPVYFTGGGLGASDAGDYYGGTDGPSANHTHGMAHTHNIAANGHTHELDLDTTITYGVYIEPDADNILLEEHLVYQLNGGADLGATVASLGGGWYELDLTSSVRNTSYQPVIYTNNLAISTVEARAATITGQLIVRNVIQSMPLV